MPSELRCILDGHEICFIQNRTFLNLATVGDYLPICRFKNQKFSFLDDRLLTPKCSKVLIIVVNLMSRKEDHQKNGFSVPSSRWYLLILYCKSLFPTTHNPPSHERTHLRYSLYCIASPSASTLLPIKEVFIASS